MRMTPLLFCLLALPLHAQQASDILVYGGTSGGVIAAVQAGRMGKSVTLIEPSRHVGGLTTGGLGATDMGNRNSIGGAALEFYQAVFKHYQDPAHWKFVTREDYLKTPHGQHHTTRDAQFGFEPKVAEKIFLDMLRNAKVNLVLGERLDLKDGVTKQNNRIVSIRTESGKTFAAKVFIDATYEGDLMAKAGVSYIVGRESVQQYDEKTAGVHVWTGKSSLKPIDPFVKKGDPSSGVLPNIDIGPIPPQGSADQRVQAYNYRLCLTEIPENRLPFEKPADYSELEYEILFRFYEGGNELFPLNPVLMPNGKTDTNNNGVFSTDYVGMSDQWPEADYATREKIAAAHVRYIKGLLWTLANHSRIPEDVRKWASKYGHAKDEFTDNNNWPYAIYVREARRMVGPYVMTEHDVLGKREAEDSVALGSYVMDSHMTRRYIDKEGYLRADGGLSGGRGFAPYPIGYRSLTPKPDQCANLLVPVCLSSSHSAYGSIRMEPVYMMLGQASATAAALAIDASTSVQDVQYSKLRERLLADGAKLEWPLATFTGLRSKKLPGLVIDNSKAERVGKWLTGSGESGVDGVYLHDGNLPETKGKMYAKYHFTIPADGQYEVRMSYVPHANRAANVGVLIDCAEGRKRATVNQKLAPPIDNTFISLGTFKFAKDKPAVISIVNAQTDGFVVIDAVQLLPK